MKGYRFYMQDFKFNILGSEWTVKFGTVEEYPNLEDMDGYTDSSTREIIVDDMKSQQDMPGSKKNMEEYKKQVVRHEIIHAFLCESGLDTNSGAFMTGLVHRTFLYLYQSTICQKIDLNAYLK